MKKVMLVLFVLLAISGLAWSQGKPFGAVSFEIGGSILAPIGVNAEFFLGPLGLGAELRGFFLGYQDTLIGSVEPGVFARLYFGSIDSSLYLMGGASYLTAWAFVEGQAATAEGGFLKPKAGVGYNALFGKNGRTRFFIEFGAVYFKAVVEGEVITSDIIPFPILPHLLFGFGVAF